MKGTDTKKWLLVAIVIVNLLLAFFMPSISFAQSNTFENESWLLRSVGSLDATSLSADMRSSAKSFSGSDGCNRVIMNYQIDAQRQTVNFLTDHGSSTLMACHGLADEVSRAFPVEMSAVRSYQISDSELRFLDAKGKVRVIYYRQPLNLTDVRWAIFGLNINYAVESSARIDPVWVHFSADNQVKIFTGCKTLSVQYQYSTNGAMNIDTQALDKQSQCTKQGDVASVHGAVLQALAKTKSWHRVGARLELRSADGALQLHGYIHQ